MEGKDWQRFYMGYKERFVDECELILLNGAVKVSLMQAPSAKTNSKHDTTITTCSSSKTHKYRASSNTNFSADSFSTNSRANDPALTGTTVWDGGVVLSQALTSTGWLTEHRRGRPWPSGSMRPHCLELGAGTGAVALSLAACHLASSVTITDIQDMIPHMEMNVRRNLEAIRAGPITARSARSPRAFTSAAPGITPPGTPAEDMKPSASAQPIDDNTTDGRACTNMLGPVIAKVPQIPQVYVRSLKWGPPGHDLAALKEEAEKKKSITSRMSQQHQQKYIISSSHNVIQNEVPGLPYDVIVGSDLIYYTYCEETPHTKLLLWTLERVATPDSLIYFALSLHHNPDEVQHFLGLAEEKFEVTHLHDQVPDPWRVPDVIVVLLKLKEHGLNDVVLLVGKPSSEDLPTPIL
ncbi:hypothetical protein CEUSTIGMA_g7804.t1 [Chlamydomonas eustigma]|uniref:Uncharacterized protein n=1 Tax=Chlamydomonas eustigma TaxID=1157962 RepID=A0A250XB91_9CHLO|nr:hypothetical protein CEUSTIGMA_g7804.t1 [Chlamydomonas eustigma]|eukprot:GAX80365.1 hypothetical protein CEUSTIGMA_g7804.t1 [Chlamydomonas eustigma]